RVPMPCGAAAAEPRSHTRPEAARVRRLQPRVNRSGQLRVGKRVPWERPSDAAGRRSGWTTLRLRISARRSIVTRRMQQSLQHRFAPANRCFGCGPSNEKGLRLKSFPQGDECVCEWRPEKHHEAFEGMLNGGICGALLDCHSNWTAAWHLMNANGLATP